MTVILKGVKEQIDVKVEAYVRGDCGQVTTVPFVMTFKRMTSSQRKVWREEVNDIMAHNPAGFDKARYIKEWAAGWKKIPTTTGEELPFDEEHLDMVCEEIDYLEAMYRGFLDMVNGADKPKN